MRITVRTSVLVFLALLLPTVTQAAKTLDHGLTNLEDLRTGALSFQVEDLRVKVQGGYVRHVRTWGNGHWQFNRRWESLRASNRDSGTVALANLSVRRPLECGHEPIPSSGTLDKISRNGAVYQRTTSEKYYRTISSPDSQVMEYDTWIEPDDQNNLIWRNRQGDWIRYDAKGDIQAYGGRNNDSVSFRYDEHGNIAGVLDVHGTEVMTYEYTPHVQALSEPLPSGETEATVYVISKVSDDHGRFIQYHYDDNLYLTAVTDVRGEQWRYEYNEGGHLNAVIDPLDRRTSIAVGNAGLVSSIHDADGVGPRFSYGGTADGYRQVREDAAGRVVETWYNRLGRQVRQTINGELEFEADYRLSNGSRAPLLTQAGKVAKPQSRDGADVCDTRLQAPVKTSGGFGPSTLQKTTRTDRYGETITTHYDQWGNEVERHRKSDDAVSRTSYHPVFNQPLEEQDFNGVVTRYEYDTKGNLIQLTEAAGTEEERITQYGWDEYGNRTSIHLLGDQTTQEAEYTFTYDNQGNITSTTGPTGTVHFVDTDHPEHDALGNAPVRIDEQGNRWVYTFDAAGNPLTETDPLNRITSHGYNAAGDAISTTAPNEATTHWTVNHAGNPLETTDALGNKTKLSYDGAGRMVMSTLPSGASYRRFYDDRGNMDKEVNANGSAITYEYDGARQIETQFPTYVESKIRDVQGRLVKNLIRSEKDSIIQERSYQFNKAGDPTVKTDAEGIATRIAYDALNRPFSLVDAQGGTTLLRYDDYDNLIGVTDPEGSATTFSYDAGGRLISEIDPEGQERNYTYYANDLRKTEINAKGEVTYYQYNPAGQLVTVNYYADVQFQQDDNPVHALQFGYNALGQLTSYSDGSTSGTHSYDALGRLESTTIDYGPFSKTHSYTYDKDGRKKTYTNPEGITYTYSYRPNGGFQSLTLPGEGSIAVTAYNWQAPAEWLFPGGTRIQTQTDGLLRPQQTQLLDPGNNPRASRLYTYNQENYITGLQTEESAHLYTLDELYRLTAVAYDYNESLQQQAEQGGAFLLEDEVYTYDSVGNRLTENGEGPWDYNANHQLKRIAEQGEGGAPEATDITFTYDANGHTTSKVDEATGKTTYYDYDVSERLRTVRESVDGNEVTLGQYQYDALGRRIKKKTANGTRYFHYDDSGLLAEYDSSGVLISEYQYTPGSPWMTNPLFKREGVTNKVHYYYNSHLGRPLKLFTKTGEITWEARSQAFGEAEVYRQQTENLLRFPGQYYDEESLLNHNYFRDYDANYGRYLQRDPIGLDGGVNTYAYAGGLPIQFVDPLGLLSVPSSCVELRKECSTSSREDRRKEATGEWDVHSKIPIPLELIRGPGRGGRGGGRAPGSFKKPSVAPNISVWLVLYQRITVYGVYEVEVERCVTIYKCVIYLRCGRKNEFETRRHNKEERERFKRHEYKRERRWEREESYG